MQLHRLTNKARSTRAFLALCSAIAYSMSERLSDHHNVLPRSTHGSAVWLDESKSAVNEIQSGCRNGFVCSACREIPESGSQRSVFVARGLPNRSRPSCIISCIVGGRASKDYLSRVSETRLHGGSTRSGSGRNGARQARSCVSLSQPS